MSRNPASESRHALTIAMIGTRGVPANYGGFETAIEEVGRRLADEGHRVIVYSRGEPGPGQHLGMERVLLPALRFKQLETLSHTGLSVVHALTRRHIDVAFVFNAANAPFLPLLRLRRVPVAVHVDGLEWKRAKWGAAGRRYYRWAEKFSVAQGDALIADAPGIADYYREKFEAPTELIRYGAKMITEMPAALVEDVGLDPQGYHLVVARFEPENHVLEIVEGYRQSGATKPLVVVGSAPYAEDYTCRIQHLADLDPRIRLMGGVWDQQLLDALYFHAYTYVHGHSVGGTNPSLLRAIGAGTSVIAYDIGFNSEIVQDRGEYFRTSADVAVALECAESAPQTQAVRGEALREFARARFDWDQVATAYADLASRLALRKRAVQRRATTPSR